jgi:uncharacterized delta-60 repeat protein
MRKQSLRRALIGALLLSICTAMLAAQAPAALAAPAVPGALDTTFAGFTDDGIAFATDMRSINSIALQGDGNLVVVGSTGIDNELGVFRYAPNGRRDISFGSYGKAIFSDLFTATVVALQSDGRIVVGGTRNDDFHLARLTPTGALDTSFDGDGWFADVDAQLSVLSDIIVQSDGKIVACGNAEVGGDSDFGVARYTANGWRDSSFSDDGKVSIPFGGEDICESVVQQNDGKLVLAGQRSSTSAFGDDDFAVARLHSTGLLDGEFDGDGKLTTGFGGDECATDVALQPDGKIVVLGSPRFEPKSSHIARYLPNGALDSTFDGDGKRTIPVDGLTDLMLQPNGKILALGHHKSPDGDNKFALHRMKSNGAPDTMFDGDGIAWLDFGGNDRGTDLALLPDGRILVAGTKDTTGVLARLWQNGTNFDTGGQQAHSLAFPPVYPAGSYAYVYALTTQADGKLLAAGELRNPSSGASEAVITRFFSNGQVDRTFGTGGTTRLWVGNFNAARAIAIQLDGTIVIAGESTWTGGWVEFMVARFLPNGAPDSSFGENGNNYRLANFSSGASVDKGTALALAPDGKIVVAGSAWNGSTWVWGVARWNSIGTPDISFDGDGKLFLDLGPASSANAVFVQPDGRIVLGGNTGGNDFALARLLDNGVLDATFGDYKNGLSITDMGGNDGVTALALASNGWIYAAGYSYQGGMDDFALTQYQPNGVLAQCPIGQKCSNWPDGKSFIDMGGSDQPYAMALRGDNRLVVAGCSDQHMAAAQVSTTELGQPIRFQTDFVGHFDCAYGVQFSGTSKEKIVLAGQQSYDSTTNIALARFLTTAYKNGSTAMVAPANAPVTQDAAVPTPPSPTATEETATPDTTVPTSPPAPAGDQTTQETTVPTSSPKPALAPRSDQVDLSGTQR